MSMCSEENTIKSRLWQHKYYHNNTCMLPTQPPADRQPPVSHLSGSCNSSSGTSRRKCLERTFSRGQRTPAHLSAVVDWSRFLACSQSHSRYIQAKPFIISLLSYAQLLWIHQFSTYTKHILYCNPRTAAFIGSYNQTRHTATHNPSTPDIITTSVICHTQPQKHIL